MSTPLSSEELIQRVRASGLVPYADFDATLAELRLETPTVTLRALLDRLVEERFLTPFQADRLAIGKYKGFRLGSYVILDRLGSGGMGQVFLAEHANLRRRTAIKVLSSPVAEGEVARERFHREARAAATLDHPYIVRVFDLNQEGPLLYLVMEYIEGITLQSLVQKVGPLSAQAAATYAWHMAVGLQHAHEKSLIHRDVKPGNILIDRAGVARLLDLGLVRDTESTDSRLTQQIGSRGVLGTVDYLAPEQAVNSSAVDCRADVYSLGATLYFALAGHPMFPEGKATQKLMWQQTTDPTPIQQLRSDIPDELALALHKALAKKPSERFQSASAFADALAPFAAQTAPPEPEWIPRPPAWRGLTRTTDPASSVRLGVSPPRSGRFPVPPRLGNSDNARAVSGPKSSNLLMNPPRPIAGVETRSGATDQTDNSIASLPDSPNPTTGDSSILSTAEARALAEMAAAEAIKAAGHAERAGVPLPIVLSMILTAAIVTGAVVWFAATR
ncbi:MAG: serine/threonine protein kinase [Bacteroidales bacterium]|nr:serine/threonine protein kinase [Bacteroidales bacterium]